MNEFDKIRNSQAHLIKDIYHNMIFNNLTDYTLNDQIRFIIFLLKDLKSRYLLHTNKVYIYGGKIKRKKRGGSFELIAITAIIIGAIWSLLSIYEKLTEMWVKKYGDNKSSSPTQHNRHTPAQTPPQTPALSRTPTRKQTRKQTTPISRPTTRSNNPHTNSPQVKYEKPKHKNLDFLRRIFYKNKKE